MRNHNTIGAAVSRAQKKMTPSERVQRARTAAHLMHSKHDSRETSAKGRAAFIARFEQEVDPERKLKPSERKRRAEHAMKAHMSRLAMKSAKARRR